MSIQLALSELTLSRATDREETGFAMDESEFRAFYERTARPLWAYLMRTTGSHDLADDLLQEAYFRFLRAGATHQNESHRRNSLFQIATNLMRDSGRRSRKRQQVSLSDTAESQVEDRKTADLASSTESRTDLAQAMEQLDPIQRQILWLAYVQGDSHDEIAAVLGLRSISIRTLLLRARRKLAGILGEDYRIRRSLESGS
ncbi:MAG: RNA polymerase sigma factor [Acidobacteria bacterium]|nr:RNA polymerase sigma factor [Acidobacteriota bacterium]